jgi:hypothetical protein
LAALSRVCRHRSCPVVGSSDSSKPVLGGGRRGNNPI